MVVIFEMVITLKVEIWKPEVKSNNVKFASAGDSGVHEQKVISV